jgi:hypothetical protein
MFKIFKFIITLSLIGFHYSSLQAANFTPSTYIVTIQQVEMCTGTDGSGSCENAKIVGNATQEMDIASVDILEVVSEYGSPAILEVGTTYTHMKTTMLRTIQMTGTADVGGVTCNTAAVTDDNYAGTEADQKYSHIPVINNGQTMALTEVRMQNESVTKCLNDDCTTTETDSSWMSYGAKDQGALYAIHNAISGDSMILIHALTKPWTVTLDTPSLDMAFGTENVGQVFAIDTGGTKYCRFDALEPTVSITIE